MPKYLYLVLACLLLPSLAGAEPGEEALAVKSCSQFLLKGEPLTVGQKKLLAVTSLHHYGKIKEALIIVKLSGSEKESAQAKRSLERLNAVEKGKWESTMFGATVGWYLFFDKGSITTIPLIIKLEKDSAAAKAGLLPGDVIDTCAGVGLKCESSRNKFAHFLHQWPASEPLKLKIRRSTKHQAADSTVKRIKKTIILFAREPAE